MSDRELLELAAFAAGYTFVRMCESEADGAILADIQEPWNPLEDDGEALRLNVRLAVMYSLVLKISFEGKYHEADPYATVRRAIVSAAAEIGKAMQEPAHV